MIDPITLKTWGEAIATLLIPTGVFTTLVGLAHKFSQEARLKKQARIDGEIQLLKTFTQIMDLANGRGPAVVSDKIIERLSPEDFTALTNGRAEGNQPWIMVLPIGAAAQNAAIAAICELGMNHKSLRLVALQALESLTDITGVAKVAKKHLEMLRKT
ncbi:hypothetical protein [Xanthomonas arboricola]|uniref:hypothetical protein n=1 Tax=Xanthomonas arboricola TaxID=56448 RepID=UPI0012904D80|nr:hypothetical protein [Xanthomonas arboricola]